MHPLVLPAVLLLLPIACSSAPGTREAGDVLSGSTSQETYEYPGCPNEDLGCPRLGTVFCALRLIEQKYAACSAAADCERATVDGRCTGYGVCPPPVFVNRLSLAAFQAEARAEIDRYCPEAGGCITRPACVLPPPGGFVPACVNGKCTAVPRDAGVE